MSNRVVVWRNGDFVAAETAVPATDRGWLIGEAVFETVLAEGGRPAFLDRHIERLNKGARAFDIEIPYTPSEIASAIAMVSAANGVDSRGVARITLTRAGGARGLAGSAAAAPRLYVSVQPTDAPKPFMRMMIATRRRWSAASTNAFKCAGSYAENILARAEAAVDGADEAVMLNESGRVACVSSGNLFLIEAQRIRTPASGEGALAGVVRGVVLEEARRLGIEAVEGPIEAEELVGAPLLLTNSIVGVVRGALEPRMAETPNGLADALIEGYAVRLDREFRRGELTSGS